MATMSITDIEYSDMELQDLTLLSQVYSSTGKMSKIDTKDAR